MRMMVRMGAMRMRMMLRAVMKWHLYGGVVLPLSSLWAAL